MKKYVIHDLASEKFAGLFPDLKDMTVIDASKSYARCTGCFGCWLKTPGECVLRDGMEHLGAFILTADEVTIISEGVYGGFSVPIKKLWDRCIPGVLPFFRKKNKELHHVPRYKRHPKFKIYFYNADDMTFDEKELAQKIVAGNALNFMCDEHETHFVKSVDEVVIV